MPQPKAPVRESVGLVQVREQLPLAVPGGSVRGERANFTGPVIGCVEAKFCKKISVAKLSPRSTQCTPLHHSRGIRLGEEIYSNLNFFR